MACLQCLVHLWHLKKWLIILILHPKLAYLVFFLHYSDFHPQFQNLSCQSSLGDLELVARSHLHHIHWLRRLFMKKWDEDTNLNHVDELSVESLRDNAAVTKIWVLQNLASVLVYEEGYRDTLVFF